MKKYFILAALAAIFAGCGITRATISKPAEGTSTTITITTNNPISTSVPITTGDIVPLAR